MAGAGEPFAPRHRGLLFLTTWSLAVVVGWGLIAMAGLQLMAAGAWRSIGPELALIAVLVVLSELRPIVMTRYSADPVSISQAFAFAALYIWGWQAAVLLIGLATLLSELLERKALWKAVFNVGQYAVSMGVAALVLQAGTLVEGVDVGALDDPLTGLSLATVCWLVLTWLAYHLTNLAFVAGLDPEGRFGASFVQDFWFYTGSTLAVLTLSPIVALVAMADDLRWVLLPLLLLPMVAVQRAAQMAQEREHRALHDPLTGLPNRTMLTDRIDAALTTSRRTGGRVVVIFLDLDQFKTINDGLGHAVGDDVLVQVADRLTAILRPGDTLARFSGDEFAIVCAGLPDSEIEPVAARIQMALEPPFTFATHEVTVTASIGVATASRHSTPESLLRDADSAMYRAKGAGRDQVAHFHWSMHAAAAARLDDHLGLRRALERDELRTHYQPVIELSSGRVLGMEALVRWQHPERGLIAPDQFIPLAEETGLILPLGTWVLDRSLRQLSNWRDQVPEARDLWIAVNLSARQLTDPDLVAKVARSLQESGIDPGSLHLEITETAVMRSADASEATLEALRSLGVRLIIDDFGTGYSSLARLKRLPVTALKIDRTFVDGLGGLDTSDRSIVDAIAQMAHSLHLDVIAEGVETREQLEILHQLGATMGQGFLWSKPLPPEAIGDWVSAALTAEDLRSLHALLDRG